MQTEHKERIHARSHTLPEKKEGYPFKCGAAALIYWVKMGRRKKKKRRRSGRGQIAESFFIHPHGWMACHRIIYTLYQKKKKKNPRHAA